MTSARRFVAVTLAAFVVAQAAWILAVPPFRGIDEIDHVYRAAAVADGQWRPSRLAHDGRGVIVEVPATLVAAASAQCDSLPYTGRDNCHPIERLPDGRVTVASGAGLYPPAYYLAVGWPTRWLDGAVADYAIRAISALLCAVGMAIAAWALMVSGAGPWTRLGFVLSATPVLVYTTILPAANSLEIVAASCLWASLLALVRRGARDRTGSLLLACATVSGALVGSLRTLGPVWLGLIVVTVVAFTGAGGVARVVRVRPAASALAAGVVTGAVALGVWWTLTAGIAGATPVELRGDAESTPSMWLWRGLLWTLQIVGAFPFRDQPAPGVVYALYFAVVIPFLGWALLRSRGRVRAVVLAAAAGTIALPLLVTAATSSSQGVIWQGRYTLPFVVGVLILGGRALDDAGVGLSWRVLAPAGAMIALAHSWSVWDVAVDESRRPTTHLGPDWITLPAPVLGAIVLLAWLMLVTGVGPREAAPAVVAPAAEIDDAVAR